MTLVNRVDLQDILTTVAMAQSTKEDVEQSSCFVFFGGRVYCYDGTFMVSAPCNIGVNVAVNGKALKVAISHYTHDDISITLDDGQLLLTERGRRCAVNVEAAIYLPIHQVPKVEEWKELDFDIHSAFRNTSKCASEHVPESWLPFLHITGSFMEATDGMQVARQSITLDTDESILVRAKPLHKIDSLELSFYAIEQNWFHLKDNNDVVVSMMRAREDPNNKYMDCSALMDPVGDKIQIPEEVSNSLNFSKGFATEFTERNIINVKLDPVDGGLLTMKSSGESGWHETELSIPYNDKLLSFDTEMDLFAAVLAISDTFIITDSSLTVKHDGFTYVTLLNVEA